MIRVHLWSTNTTNEAAYISRWFALQVSAGFTFNNWYTYTDSVNGALVDDQTNILLHPVSDAWTQIYNWLNGSYPDNNPFCSHAGTVWTCPFTTAGGQRDELVWDSQYGPHAAGDNPQTQPSDCANAANPLICGSTSFPVPGTYAKDWVDIKGKVHAYQANVTIGAMAILLEGG